MKTNLLLLAIILGGGWYLFHMGTTAPEAPVAVAPAPRASYSNVRTYYSPLNDPAVSAGRRASSTQNLGATGLGNSSQTGLSLGGTATANPGVFSPSTVSRPNPVRTSGDGSNLNVSKRADDIARAARGE